MREHVWLPRGWHGGRWCSQQHWFVGLHWRSRMDWGGWDWRWLVGQLRRCGLEFRSRQSRNGGSHRVALAYLHDCKGHQKGQRRDHHHQQHVSAGGIAGQFQIAVLWIAQGWGVAHAAARLEMPARSPPAKKAGEPASLRTVGPPDRDRFRDGFLHGGHHHGRW